MAVVYEDLEDGEKICPDCCGHGSYQRNRSDSRVDYHENTTYVRCNSCRGKGKIKK